MHSETFAKLLSPQVMIVVPPCWFLHQSIRCGIAASGSFVDLWPDMVANEVITVTEREQVIEFVITYAPDFRCPIGA